MEKRMMDKNREILCDLKKYLPEGCIHDGDHVPVRGSGCWYQDANGKQYLDFSSGIFTNSFGHGCERLIEAGHVQSELLANIHGRHSEAELRFYQRLFPHLPAEDYRAIPYNDGGYTIDRGITDIINFHDKKRIAIGAFRGGFHGKTQAAKLLINETERAALFDNFLMDYPNCYRCPWKRERGTCGMECAVAVCRELKMREAEAIIFEPIQGSGVIIPPKDFWKIVSDFCRRQGILMFADEVLTGGGRVGSYLASSYFGIVPDMIALTKGLANGKPLSVLLEREYITKNRYATRRMERSSTFAAHPEALAVAAEQLLLLEEYNILGNVKDRSSELEQGLLAIGERFPIIGDVRCIGLMTALEFVENKEDKVPDEEIGRKVLQRCRENGMEVIGSGHIIRLAPPLVIQKSELDIGIGILEKSIEEAFG